jgi:hypothetical protein
MNKAIGSQLTTISFERLPSGRTTQRLLLSATALVACLSAGVWLLQVRPTATIDVAETQEAIAPSTNAAGPVLVDVRGAANVEPVAELKTVKPTGKISMAPSAPPPVAGAAFEAAPLPTQTAEVDGDVTLAPLPPRRPDAAELKTLSENNHASAPTRVSGLPFRRTASAAAPTDNRNFLEKFFGIGEPSGQPARGGQALAYAAQETVSTGRSLLGNVPSGSSTGATVAAARYDNRTAVYDISAKTVYLPDGTRLEAHSGLGDRLDDPRYVNERMKGATPPHVYELTPREALFHGVPALRLNPVGGGGAIYGRAGLLAHTYMLGPNGDSNGCVSFRDYYAFLRAYQSGMVKRLAVVAHL